MGTGLDVHPDRASLGAGARLAELPPGESLAEVIERHGRRRPDAVLGYFVGADGAIEGVSWAEMMARAEALAACLIERGASPGARIVLALQTTSDLLAGFLACQVLGAVPCIVEPPPGGRGLAPWAERLTPKLRVVEPWAILTPDDSVEGVTHALCKEPLRVYDARPPASTGRIAWHRADPGAAAFLQFTSGTTDRPKAIACSHRAVLANVRGVARVGKWNERDLIVSWLPLFHDLGLVAASVAPLCLGIPAAWMSPKAFLMRPARWLWAIHVLRGSISFAPNFAYQLCVKRLEQQDTVGLDLTSWRLAINAAEFVHAETIRDFERKFATAGFSPSSTTPSYGMAEMVVAISSKRAGEPVVIDRISRSALSHAGRAVPVADADVDAMEVVEVGEVLEGHAVRIVGADGKERGEREEGEILVQGPSLFSGYHGNAAATGKALADGWLRTGDLGYLVGARLFVSGRAKEIIIRGGENYHPHLLELAASGVEGVREGCVAAVGVPNPDSGTEDIVIVYETHETSGEALLEIGRNIESTVQACTGLRPDRVLPLAPRSIPKTTSGKIRRGLVRQHLRQHLANMGPESEGGARRVLLTE
jgi:acyl-CoA synthetase (AMP-forming)/AMP-acid ligase II